MATHVDTKDVKHKVTQKAKALQAKASGKAFPSIHGVKKSVVGIARNIKHSTADTAQDMADYMGDRVDDLKDAGTAHLKRATLRVKAKPAQSIAIAFTAGLLTSMLLRRPSASQD